MRVELVRRGSSLIPGAAVAAACGLYSLNWSCPSPSPALTFTLMTLYCEFVNGVMWCVCRTQRGARRRPPVEARTRS